MFDSKQGEGRPAGRYFEAADAERDTLRQAVAAVDNFIAHLPKGDSGPERGLPASWATLVKLLALGEPRQLRDCPRCGHVSMRDATCCGSCWHHLTPLPPLAADRQIAGGGADS
ncbi:MAG: hypothetical protein IPJ65_14905 [Archangiaceae bacterium]|nr:hypothetical protein [Archangiaceae bacterium]